MWWSFEVLGRELRSGNVLQVGSPEPKANRRSVKEIGRQAKRSNSSSLGYKIYIGAIHVFKKKSKLILIRGSILAFLISCFVFIKVSSTIELEFYVHRFQFNIY